MFTFTETTTTNYVPHNTHAVAYGGPCDGALVTLAGRPQSFVLAYQIKKDEIVLPSHSCSAATKEETYHLTTHANKEARLIYAYRGTEGALELKNPS